LFGRRVHDLDDERLTVIAEAGVDVQVLLLTAPGVQNFGAPDRQRALSDIRLHIVGRMSDLGPVSSSVEESFLNL
jgi:hypothetical protein